MPRYPKPPTHIGKKRKIKTIYGDTVTYVIEDEIIHRPKSNKKKVIYLQKLHFIESDYDELRLCYYMIGEKPRMRGKWAYAQSAPMIRKEDLKIILQEAEKKGML